MTKFIGLSKLRIPDKLYQHSGSRRTVGLVISDGCDACLCQCTHAMLYPISPELGSLAGILRDHGMNTELILLNFYRHPFTNTKIWTPERERLWLHYVLSRYAAFENIFLWTISNEYETHPDGIYRLDSNETASRRFNFSTTGKGPIGSELSHSEGPDSLYSNCKVIGVVKDFNFGSLHEKIKPLVVKLGYHRFEMVIRLSPNLPKHQTLNLVNSL